MVILPIKNRQQTYTVNPTKIIALGLNYHSHINESVSVKASGSADIPDEPILFPKTPNVLVGPNEPIILPKFINDYEFNEPRTDYEAELAVIIKNTCKNVSEEDAWNHILGYTCFNDVSQRNLQLNDRSGWYRGKSLDTYGPIGPVLVKPEDIGDPMNLDVQCLLNGKVVQQGNTNQMIFNVPQIISFISKNFTLLPGDIISTGTPAGVGPLKAGDTVTVNIENIGKLTNSVKEED